MEEIEITAKVEKNKPLNEMSSVSTRAFSVEETQKFAAAANDPARMALAFAGVAAAGDAIITFPFVEILPTACCGVWKALRFRIPTTFQTWERQVEAFQF